MKHILSYIKYFIVVFFVNAALLFLIGYALYFLKLTGSIIYVFTFVFVTFLCGLFYTCLSGSAVYKSENIIKPKKIEKFIISFMFLLFYIGFWGEILFLIDSIFFYGTSA